MPTARATTDSSGHINSFEVSLGRPLSNNQFYSDRTKSTRNWVFKKETTLNELRYYSAAYLSVVACHMIDTLGFLPFEPADLYQDKGFRIYAIHCPKKRTVAIADQKLNYSTTNDCLFKRQSKGAKK